METELTTKMVAMGYRPLTIKQKKYELKKYFGNPVNFKNAWDWLMKVKEEHKRGYESNRINSIIRLLPELKPDEETYKEFLQKQKEWNEKRKSFYLRRDNTVEDVLQKLKDKSELLYKSWQNSKGSPKELKTVRDYILSVLYVEFPEYIGRSVEFRTLQWRRQKNKQDQNYVTLGSIILNNYKKSGKKEKDGSITRLKDGQIRLLLPEKLVPVIRRLRKITKTIYIFGGNDMMSQPAFSLYQKRVLGYATNKLRKIMVQHREGIQKKKMQEVAVRMGNTVNTIMGHYS